MQDRHDKHLEVTAALLERAYRMTLLLLGRIGQGVVETDGLQAGSFDEFVITKELEAILDEARATLLAASRKDSAC